MTPRGIKVTFWLMCILNPCFYYLSIGGHFLELGTGLADNEETRHFEFVISTLIFVLSYVVLWFYLSGRNWARILVLLTSVVVLLDLSSLFADASTWGKVELVTEACLALFLLFFLNTVKVKRFFEGGSVSHASVRGEG